jgi:hypothetical protein
MPEFSAVTQNLIDKLPQGKGPFLKSKSDALLGLVYHHEGSPTPEGSSVWTIADYHVKTLGWDHIGYHFVIDRKGVIYQTLDPTTRGYHAGYTRSAGDDIRKFPNQDPQFYNDFYLAACIVGNDPTDQQLESMIQLGTAFKKAGGPKFEIKGHRELPGKATSCPGDGFSMDYLRGQITARIEAPADPNAPGPGDADWAKQFTSWKTAAISLKGTADLMGNQLVATQGALRQASQALRSAADALDAADREITKITGR